MGQSYSPSQANKLEAEKRTVICGLHFNKNFLSVDFKKPPEENVSKSKIEWIDLYCDSGDSSEYCNEILSYISGYVHRRILFNEKCSGCYDFLKSSCKKTSSFLNFVNEGGLCKPSEHVDFLIKKTNTMLTNFESKSNLICQKNFTKRMTLSVMNMLAECYPNFMAEIDHCDSDLESHRMRMIKKIVSLFISLKMKHFAKEKKKDLVSKRIRRTYTKLILFENQ